MVEGQLVRSEFIAAVLACPKITQEYVKACKGGPRLGLHIFAQRDDAGYLHMDAWGSDDFVVFGYDVDAIQKYGFDSFLPGPKREGKIAQRTIIGIQYQCRTAVQMVMHVGVPYVRSVPPPLCPDPFRSEDGDESPPIGSLYHEFIHRPENRGRCCGRSAQVHVLHERIRLKITLFYQNFLE